MPSSPARKPSKNAARWCKKSCALSPKRCTTSTPTRKTPKRSSAKISKPKIPKDSNAPTKPTTAAFPEVPYPNTEGVKTLLDDMAPRDKKAAAADPKSFVDMSLVQELEASGFIKQLYRR